MTIILFIGSLISFLLGCVMFSVAKGAVHEIEGLLLFLISVGFFCSMAVVSAINRAAGKLDEIYQAVDAIDLKPSQETCTTTEPEPHMPEPEVDSQPIVDPEPPKVKSWVDEAKAEMLKGKA